MAPVKYPSVRLKPHGPEGTVAFHKRAAAGDALPHEISSNLTEAEKSQLRTDTVKRQTDVFHELPSTHEMAASALAGKAKKGWYQKAANAISNVFGPDAPRFSALLAAMSPQTSVEWNFHNALRTFINWDKAGRPTDRTSIVKIMGDSVMGNKKTDSVLKAWINNSVRALTHEDPESLTLSGPKVHSFMSNLQGKVNEVTLDAWMANWARIDQKGLGGGLTKTGPGKSTTYLGYSAKVRSAAKLLSEMTGDKWTPAEVQETMWSWAKTAYEHAEEFGSLATIPELVKNKEITDELIKGTSDFHNLFREPGHAGALRDSNFAQGLDRLSAAEGAEPGSAAASEKGEGAQRALDPYLQRASERLEQVRKDRNEPTATDLKVNPDHAMVNIGMNVNDGSTISHEDIAAALKEHGVDIVDSKVHQSNTEPTLVARLSRPLTDDEAHEVSEVLHQDAIAQMHNGQGELHGPRADAWKPFNPEYFMGMNGKPVGEGADMVGAEPFESAAHTKNELNFSHYSAHDADEFMTDPNKYGTGLRGAESARMINDGAPKVTSAYSAEPGAYIEPELRGLNRYGINVPRSEMYDLSADPNGYVEKASKNGQYDHTKVEKLIKKAGYTGYHLPDGDGVFRGQARFFKPVKAVRATEDAAARRGEPPRVPLSAPEVRDGIKDIQEHLGLPVNVVDDYHQLPTNLPMDAGTMQLLKDPSVNGMFFDSPSGGSVHIIAGRVGSIDEARQIAIHVTVGHYGLRGVLGARYRDVMGQLARSFPNEVAEAAKRNGLKVSDPMAAEEMVAYASEKLLTDNASAQQSAYGKVMNFVRTALQRVGLLKGWSDDQLHNLIYTARDFVRSQAAQKQIARDRLAMDAGQSAFNPGGDNFATAAHLSGVPSGGNKDLESFLGKIGAKDKRLRERWEDATNDIKARVETAVFDHFHGIDRAESVAGVAASDRGYKSASLSTNAGGLTRAVLEDGAPVWIDKSGKTVTGRLSAAGDVHDIDSSGRGLLDIFKPLGKDLNKWAAWMVANRAARLKTEGRENMFSDAEIAAAQGIGANDPRFAAVAKEYSDFKGKMLDWAQQAGIIDPDSRAMWDHADYIPFYRVMENGNMNATAGNRGLGYVKNQIARLKGGTNNLGDPVTNIMTNFSNMIEAGLRAHAMRATADNLEGSGFITKVKGMKDPVTTLDRAGFKGAHPDLVKDLSQIGVDIDHMPDDAFRGLQKMMEKGPAGDNAVTVWRDGKREDWLVHDPVLFKSLQSISPDKWGPWMNIFRLPKKALTFTSTLTPEFAASVGWKHMWQAFIQGRTGDAATPFMPVLDNVKGAVKFLTHADVIKHARAQGGLFEGLGYDPVNAAKEAQMTAQRAQRIGLINTPRKAWLAYRSLIGVSENMNRVAIYEGAKRAGMSPMESAFEAKSTMDYHKKGNAKLAKFIFDSVPFMGAHVSALHTLVKNATSSPQAAARVVMRGSLMAMASIAYVAMNHNDDRYKSLTDKDKASYWHFWTPTGMHIRIPKPFETGTIFGTIPEAMMDSAVTNSDEPDKNWAALSTVAHSFLEEDSLSPRVAAVWPAYELAINKNTYNGSPILTQSDQKVEPEEQDAPYVHSTYRFLAHEMPDIAPSALRSPKQLEHLGQGYFGGVQDYALAVTDALARRANGESAPATDHESLPLFRRFFNEGPMSQTKYSNTMYQVADDAAKVMGSAKVLAKDPSPQAQARLDQLIDKNQDLLAANGPMNSAAKDVNGLRKQMRDVQTSDMSPDEKREALDTLQTAINETAKSVWDIRPGGKLAPSVADKLQGLTKDQQVTQLHNDGKHATARLLQSLPASPPPGIAQ